MFKTIEVCVIGTRVATLAISTKIIPTKKIRFYILEIMTKFKKTLYLVLLVLFITPPVNADLFKWVDEDGKIHYSDSAPGDQVKADIIPLEKESGPQSEFFQQSSAKKAIIRPYEKTARKLHLLDTLYMWKRESEIETTSKIGAYHAGKGCTSRGAMTMPDVFIHQKNLFPRESDLVNRIRKVVNGLDYDSERTKKYDLIRRLKKSGGLSLHSEVIEMDFNTCAPNLRKSERLGPITEVSTGRFRKHRIKLKILWTLKSNRDQNIVYETITEGRYNGWHKESSSTEAILGATESATLMLYTDKEFIAHTLIQEDDVDLDDILISGGQPIRSSGKLKTRDLYFSINENSWSRKLTPDQAIGNLLFGPNCSTKKPFSMADATSRRIEFLPGSRKSTDIIIKKIRALGYSIKPLTDNTDAELLNASGFSLQAELMEVLHDACAPALSASTKYKSIEKLNTRRLTRKRTQIKIKWTLRSDSNRKIVYQSVTDGVAGSLLTESSSSDIMKEVVGMAAQRLFADQSFIDALVIKNKRVNLVNEPFDITTLKTPTGILNSNPENKSSLFVVINDDPWRQIPTNKVIGYYAYGSQCTPYKGRKWPNAINDYSRLFVKSSEIATAQSKVIKSLAYKYQVTDQSNVVNMKRTLGGYSLHSEIQDLRYDSCAPNESGDVISKNKKLSSGRFNRHRAKITIQWKLIADDDKLPLYETTTSGVSDSWLLNSKGNKILGNAVENAITQLFAQQKFVDKLTVEDEKGFFSGLLSFLDSDSESTGNDEVVMGSQQSYIIKAHTAQTLSEMSTLKMMMTEHYMVSGSWPDDISDLGISESMYQNSKTIAHINIQSDGSIVAELKDIVGNNKIIRLTPEDNSSSVGIGHWECTSNIPRHALVSACQSF